MGHYITLLSSLCLPPFSRISLFFLHDTFYFLHFITIFHSFPSILYYILLLSPLYLPPFSTTTFLFNLSSLYLSPFFSLSSSLLSILYIFLLSLLYLPPSPLYLLSFSSISSSFLYYIFLLSVLYLPPFSTISSFFLHYFFILFLLYLPTPLYLPPFSFLHYISSFFTISSFFLFYIVLLSPQCLSRSPQFHSSFSAYHFPIYNISSFLPLLVFIFSLSFSLRSSAYLKYFSSPFCPPAFSSAFSHQPFPLMKISLNPLDYTKSRLHCM